MPTTRTPRAARHVIDGVKRYTSLNTATIPRVDFELEVFRSGEPEVHRFTATPVMDLGSVLMFLSKDDDAGGQAMLRLMRVNLADDDGVPARWEPTMLPRPGNAGPNWQAKFRAPKAPHGDGELHTMDEVHLWTDPVQGSSRRRWDSLMFEDEGVVVSAEVVMEIIKDLMGQAAGLPTSGS